MNIINLFYSFKTQEQAVEHLEKVRWGGDPQSCVYCDSEHVGLHECNDRAIRRWQCRDCKRSFSVTVGTIFHRTHMPLRDWYLVLALMLNAKKSASACQIARDLGIRRPTVWSMMHRIRVAMASDLEQGELLYGIVEADETYVGGKPRSGNNRKPVSKAKRGRGTSKTAVIGMVERGGRVIAKPTNRLTSNAISKFVGHYLDKEASLLITDEFKGYKVVGKTLRHAVINHSRHFVDGDTHTNTIEGFWAIVKRQWYGTHHHYANKYMPLYLAEACFKYNLRKHLNAFVPSLKAMVAA